MEMTSIPWQEDDHSSRSWMDAIDVTCSGLLAIVLGQHGSPSRELSVFFPKKEHSRTNLHTTNHLVQSRRCHWKIQLWPWTKSRERKRRRPTHSCLRILGDKGADVAPLSSTSALRNHDQQAHGGQPRQQRVHQNRCQKQGGPSELGHGSRQDLS